MVLGAIFSLGVMPGGAGRLSQFLCWCGILLTPEALLDRIQDFLAEMLLRLPITGHLPGQPLQLVYVPVDFSCLFSCWVCIDDFYHGWLCPQVSHWWWLPPAAVDGTVMFCLPHGCGMDEHPVQQEVVVEPEGYPPLRFCEVDICIKLPFCLSLIYFSLPPGFWLQQSSLNDSCISSWVVHGN